MPRQPRPQFPNGLYHVTARGIRGNPIFTSGIERRRFLRTLEATIDGFGWTCLAYCLMTNHYHLVVETAAPNISAGMHRLNGAYARWFNRRHGHSGHLFQDRFYSGVIDEEGQLLETCRYILLNPVRAGIVRTPADWSWSSYRATLAPARHGFIAVSRLLGYFGAGDPAAARRRFHRFVADGLDARGRPGHAQVPGTGTRPG
jgi:putative transposase